MPCHSVIILAQLNEELTKSEVNNNMRLSWTIYLAGQKDILQHKLIQSNTLSISSLKRN